MQLIRVDALVGQRSLDLLQPAYHLCVRIINIVLQITRLECIVRMRGALPAALLIGLQHEALPAATVVRALGVHALLIARLLRLALVHVLLAVATRKARRTAARLRRRAIAAVLTARGADSCVRN